MVAQLIRSVESEQFKDNIPYFGPGDNVRVHARVVEGTRERIQVFEGVVIRRRAGGINENFTVRRIASHGVGVERTFLIHSPRIDKIEVVRHGRVRRAKLYYLRGLTGRAARIKERRRPLRVTAPPSPVVEDVVETEVMTDQVEETMIAAEDEDVVVAETVETGDEAVAEGAETNDEPAEDEKA